MEERKDLKHHECKYCGRFCFAEEINDHEETHITNKLLYCGVCGTGFSRRSYLREHLIIHKGVQPHKCIYCGKLFSLRCNLVRHLRIHTGEKPFSCPICNKLFRLKKNLVDHVRIHTGEKPHQCSICDNRFARRSTLVRHAISHSGERKFECDHCGRLFAWKYYLQKHVLIHLENSAIKRKKRRSRSMVAQEKAKSSKISTRPSETTIKIEEDEGGCHVYLSNFTTRMKEEGIEEDSRKVLFDKSEVGLILNLSQKVSIDKSEIILDLSQKTAAEEIEYYEVLDLSVKRSCDSSKHI